MAELFITERMMDGIAVLELDGDITIGQGTEKLRAAIRRLLAEEKDRIWLNLEKTGYVDSSGIGELISGLTAISRKENGQLRLLNPSERLVRLLEICKLLDIFDIGSERKTSAK